MNRRTITLGALLATLLSSLILVVAATPAFACSCARLTAEQTLESADVVFVGSVKKRLGPLGTGPGARPLSGLYVFRFRADDVFKGDVRPKQTVVTSTDTAAGCGVDRFDRGAVVIAGYLPAEGDVFLGSARDELGPAKRAVVDRSPIVSSCGLMNTPSVADTVRILGKPHKPRAG